MPRTLVLTLAITLAALGARCAPGQTLPPISISGDADGVVALPANVPAVFRDVFTKYTKVTAPNGKPIHILAQSGVRDAQVARAREVLRFFLTDVPGSRFGADKSPVSNSMGNRSAILLYFESERAMERALDGRLGDVEMNAQPLFADESPIEGSPAWLHNTIRDATFEEIFHLVHDQGILRGLPAFQREIQAATQNAMSRGIWEASQEWIQEGSTTQEYIISVFDVYMGLWAHDPDGDGTSFYGEYAPLDREDLQRKDPRGYALMEMFHPSHMDTLVRLDASFDGLFSMTEEAGKTYTLKSRYLTDVALTGTKDSGLLGNERANRLIGNSGANRLLGGGGNDVLDGGGGEDVAVFSGRLAEYEVGTKNGVTTVRDTVGKRDGTDTLSRVEHLEFRDATIGVEAGADDGGGGNGGGGNEPRAPRAPGGLIARVLSSHSVRLAWRDRSDNETRFLVERKRPGKSFRRVAVVDADGTTYRDRGLRPDRVYVYRVRAANKAGRSAPTSPVRVRTDE